MKLSLKVQSLKESGSLKLSTKISEAIQQGDKVYDLTASEFPFKPLHTFVDQIRGELNFLKSFQYASPLGVPDLRKKLVNYFVESRNLDLNDQEAFDCLLSNGSQQSLHNVLKTLCKPEAVSPQIALLTMNDSKISFISIVDESFIVLFLLAVINCIRNGYATEGKLA